MFEILNKNIYVYLAHHTLTHKQTRIKSIYYYLFAKSLNDLIFLLLKICTTKCNRELKGKKILLLNRINL